MCISKGISKEDPYYLRQPWSVSGGIQSILIFKLLNFSWTRQALNERQTDYYPTVGTCGSSSCCLAANKGRGDAPKGCELVRHISKSCSMSGRYDQWPGICP